MRVAKIVLRFVGQLFLVVGSKPWFQDLQRAAETRLAGGDRAIDRRMGVGTNGDYAANWPSPRPVFGAASNALLRRGSTDCSGDKTRPSRIKLLGPEAAGRVVALTLGEPPGETTHWTGALMAGRGGAQCEFGSTYLAHPWFP